VRVIQLEDALQWLEHAHCKLLIALTAVGPEERLHHGRFTLMGRFGDPLGLTCSADSFGRIWFRMHDVRGLAWA